MVHQHFMLVEPFTVLENVVLGVEGGFLLKAGLARARAELLRLGREYHLEVDLDARVGDLGVGQRQRVEILKALYRGADLLILDEPTAVLTPQEADHLFRILRALRAEGKTVVLITHKLREIREVTDVVTVMRQGRVVATLPTAGTTSEQLAELMVGRRVSLQRRQDARPARRGGPRGGRPHGRGRAGRGARQGRELRGAARRDRRDRRRRRQRPVGALRGARRHPPREVGADPLAGPGHHGRAHALSARDAPARALPRARGPPADGPRHPLLGPGERHPRLPRRVDLQPRAPAPPGRGRGELPSPGGGLRHPAHGRIPPHLGLLGRQPAEDRAGARARPEPGPPPRRPADARRGHRRDRVHPPAPRRAPRRREGDPPGLGRAGRDPGARRPHPGHARRAHRRGGAAGDRHRAGHRPHDGGRATGTRRRRGRCQTRPSATGRRPSE